MLTRVSFTQRNGANSLRPIAGGTSIVASRMTGPVNPLAALGVGAPRLDWPYRSLSNTPTPWGCKDSPAP